MTKDIRFIEGHFSPAEAADVLLSLLNDKIKYHTVKSLNLRNEESHTEQISEGRIQDLKAAKKIVEQLVISAHKKGKQLEINGNIKIKLVDN